MAEPSRRSAARTRARATTIGRTAVVAVLVVGYVGGTGCAGNGRGDGDGGGGGGGGADGAEQGPARAVRLASCDGPPAGQPVEITFVHAETGVRGGRIAGYVDEFEAAHPDIDVDVVSDPDGSEAALERWRSRTPSERPELVLLPHTSTGRLVDSGQTVAPGGCIRQVAPDMLPAIRGTWSAGGVLQAVPFSVSTPVLLYNRRLFRAAGLDPEPPATLGDLQLDAIKLVQQGAEAGLVVDTGPESGASWVLEHLNARIGEVAVTPRNGRQGLAESVAWRSGPALETLRWLDEGLDEGWILSVGRNPSGRRNLDRAAEAASPIAMTFHTCGALGEVFDALDDGGFPQVDLGVAPLPTPEQGPDPAPGHGSLPGGSALWLAGGKPPDETAAAWALASYLATPAVQADWAAATGYVPISPTAARQPAIRDRWERHPEMRVAYDVLAGQGTTPAELGPLAGPLAEIRELEAEAVDNVVDGTDPADALTAAADDADRLLDAYAASR